jgi:hypothetical protein
VPACSARHCRSRRLFAAQRPLVAAGGLNHAIVASLLMFSAIHAHGPFGYLDWAGTARRIDSLPFCIHVMSVIAARRIAQCPTPGGAC